MFIAVETIVLVFLQRLWNILEHLLLFDHDALTFSSLDTQQSLAEDGFASHGGHAAFERHPDWEASDDFDQDGSERPNIKTPGLAILIELDSR